MSAAGAASTSCPLTGRHLQVLALIAEGLSTHRIARRLGISPLTVKSHTIDMTTRTGVHGRAAQVGWAFRAGYLRWSGDRVVVDRNPRPRLFWLDGEARPVAELAAKPAADLTAYLVTEPPSAPQRGAA